MHVWMDGGMALVGDEQGVAAAGHPPSGLWSINHSDHHHTPLMHTTLCMGPWPPAGCAYSAPTPPPPPHTHTRPAPYRARAQVEHLDVAVVVPGQHAALLVVVGVADGHTPAVPTPVTSDSVMSGPGCFQKRHHTAQVRGSTLAQPLHALLPQGHGLQPALPLFTVAVWMQHINKHGRLLSSRSTHPPW
jgi:hypothetical protein